MTFNITTITLYPDSFPGTLGVSLPNQALKEGLWQLDIINPRDFATDKHATVDDTTYGGGNGMVLKADVISKAIDQAIVTNPNNKLISLSPRGKKFQQEDAQHLSTQSGLTFICGRFEGVDQRIIDHYQPQEYSIGDYVLFGGEIAAQVIAEATLRYIKGIIKNAGVMDEESFNYGQESQLLLEYPHYTKPPIWNGHKVPEILLSGDHQKIKQWRKKQAEQITKTARADLWEKYNKL